jgi:hypothetical protein
MDTMAVIDTPKVTAQRVRPLLGRRVTVRTSSSLLCGTLLSCVKRSAWLVVDDDTDVVLPLDDIAWVDAA